ncbi:MAG: hypothetical protein JNM63_01685, partial [Spirochaetia bacterium]|nr:hypothetical protein [Spirochaetia bacterium]
MSGNKNFLAFAAAFLVAQTVWAVDTFTQPFTSDSPWNRPVPSNAVYEDIEGMTKIDGSINFQDRWTTFVYKTDGSSRKAKLYIAEYTLHGKRARKEVAYTNNPDDIEEKLRASSKAMNVFPAN